MIVIPVLADISLIAGNHTVELSSGYCWTVNYITKNGHPICDQSGSAQGTVLVIDGQWTGSIHGNENLLSTKLFVDGVQQSLVDGNYYAGNNVQITYTSILGGAYQKTCTMAITPDSSNEHITFQGLDESKYCETFYGFLGPRSNRLTEYAAFDANGSLLHSGSNDKNNDTAVDLGNSNAIAQYDPLTGDGILSIVTGAEELNLNSFIWDRTEDNKLYFRMLGAEGAAKVTNFFEFNQSSYFFEADAESWREVASSLVSGAVVSPEPSLTKVDDVNGYVSPGKDITYSICYAANGYGDTNVVIIDTLPPEVSFDSASGNYSRDSNTVTWYIGTLEPDESGCVTLTVKVGCVMLGSAIVNQCKMRGDCISPVYAEETTSVCARYPTLIKVDDVNVGDCRGPDDYITYSICYDANGYGDSNVRITDFLLPNEVNYVSSEPCGSYNSGNHTVTWGIDFPANACGCVELVVQVNSTAEQGEIITNCCEMNGDCIHDIKDCENTRICWPYDYIIYVDTNAVGDNNGTSWKDAFVNLQDAIEKLLPSPPGPFEYVEIWVAEGTYKPDCNSAHSHGSGDRNATFSLINNAALYGGFPAGGGLWETRNPNAHKTILSGDLKGNDRQVGEPCDLLTDPCRAENSYHVVTGSGTNKTAVLNGFTITAGYSPSMRHYKYNCGGGMYNYNSSPTVTNCTFSSNTANYGGGMYNVSSSPTITNCTFNNNSASYYGGGMYNWGSATVTNCTFNNNSASYCGGGMYNGGSPTITNCTFSGNQAYSSDYPYCFGGGICCYGNRTTKIINCILYGDMASDGNEIALFSSSIADVNYSDVNDGNAAVYIDPGCTLIWGRNIDADPCFVEPGYWGDVNDPNTVVEPNNPNAMWFDGNYRLLSDSPCIDAGDNNSVPPDYADLDYDGDMNEPTPLDLYGYPRIIDGDCNGTAIVDMGAYEFNYAYMGDFDYDCTVNFADYAVFALAWLSGPPDPQWNRFCDIGTPADSYIDFADLNVLAENWLVGAGP